MAQPPPYTPATDFSAEEANNQAGRSTVRTTAVDAELAAVEVTLDAILVNLAIIQRDDGQIRDGMVKLHTLGDDVKSLLATTGCVVRGAWLTATLYQLKDIVTQGGLTYICAAVHTSGTFATDLAALKWIALNSELAVNQSFTPAAGIAATNVQAALEEVGNQIGDGRSGGYRNRIINGDMRIDQRNNGNAVTSGFPVDRWRWDAAGTGAVSMQRSTATPPAGFTHFVRVTVTTADASLAAGDTYLVSQFVEGTNFYDLDFGLSTAQPVTISFWVRSSLTGTFSGAISNQDGSTTRGYAFTYTINQANTWERKTVTIAGDTGGTWPTSNAQWGALRFDLGSGSAYRVTAGSWTTATTQVVGATGASTVIGTLSATWDITGVQFEAGTVATPFERRPYGMELALCQRYFEKSYDITTNPGTNTGLAGSIEEWGGGGVNFSALVARVRFAVSKRIPPLGTAYDAIGNSGRVSAFLSGVQTDNLAGFSLDNLGHSGFKVYYANTNLNRLSFHWTASAEW